MPWALAIAADVSVSFLFRLIVTFSLQLNSQERFQIFFFQLLTAVFTGVLQMTTAIHASL